MVPGDAEEASFSEKGRKSFREQSQACPAREPLLNTGECRALAASRVNPPLQINPHLNGRLQLTLTHSGLIPQ